MLKIRMTCLSEEEMEAAVSERCSFFGTVTKVKVYCDRKARLARPFALVDMETPEQAEKLAAALGRLAGDNAVIIFLQQQESTTSTLIQARSGGMLPDNAPVPH